MNSYIMLLLGTDAMASKETQTKLIKENQNCPKDLCVEVRRKTVSSRAPTFEKKCPMQIIIFLGQDDQFYLSTKSCLQHPYHPFLKADAILYGQSDMEQADIDLLSLLFSVEATPLQISQNMQSLKGTVSGTLLPKRVYDMNQKTEQLHDLALGLFAGCSDAEKTIANLEK
jgi:hypothetical protein